MTNLGPSSQGQTPGVADGSTARPAPAGATPKVRRVDGIDRSALDGPVGEYPQPRFPDERDGGALFGLVSFDGPDRCASSVLVPFATALEADRYATTHGLADYVVAPLSFLAAR